MDRPVVPLASRAGLQHHHPGRQLLKTADHFRGKEFETQVFRTSGDR
jgi:hypothetical protein